jgi:plasmid stabilization system protein ParE
MSKRKHLYTEKFSKSFDDVYNYINDDSPQNAKKFAKELDKKIDSIKEQPTAFPPEPALPTKRNWYRFAIFMKSWKIVYKVTSELLVFLGIVHTKRHDRELKRLRTNRYE